MTLNLDKINEIPKMLYVIKQGIIVSTITLVVIMAFILKEKPFIKINMHKNERERKDDNQKYLSIL